MSLQLPVLDDTDFERLVEGALRQIDAALDVEWSAAPQGDPGRMLIEAMAYLADQTVYRLNRLPAKVYIAFLRLLGHTLHPPIAAEAWVEWMPQEGAAPAGAQIEVPRGTRISTGESPGAGSAPVFVTLEPLRVPLADASPARQPGVRARHCAWVLAEELGTGTGQPGLTLQVAHPPIVEPWGDREFDVRVWVEAGPEKGGKPHPDRPGDPRTYVEWTEVPRWIGGGRGARLYTVDRHSGTIAFAPAARFEVESGEGGAALQEVPQPLGAVPGRGAQIVASYAHGGGAAGNVLLGTLTRVLDPVQLVVEQADGAVVTTAVRADEYLAVTNPRRAEGGQEAETLENALLRGPQALYAGQQAVTARDYERLVRRAAATLGRDQIARARALAQAARWAYAEPGTVEIQLVPRVPAGEPPRLERLRQLAQEVDLAPIRAALAEQAAIGTRAELLWAHYKPVRVQTTLLVDSESESPAAVEDAVRQRLDQFINPFHDPEQPLVAAGAEGPESAAWPLGRSLRLDEVEAVIKGTPGVVQARRLELHVAAPNVDVRCLSPDPHQPGTWYAGSRDTLYRSLDDGLGWDEMRVFAGETIRAIRPNPDRAGLVGLVTSADGASADAPSAAHSWVYVSTDCGRTWARVTDYNDRVTDLGWLLRANLTILLLATDQGLYEFELDHGRREPPRLDVPTLVPVDPGDIKAAIHTLAVVRGQRGQARVAVALKRRGGVWLSDGADLVPDGGAPLDPAQVADPTRARTVFQPIPALEGQDVRHLATQQAGTRSYLWAGAMAEGNEALGCYRRRVDRAEGRWFNAGWQGGSCRALAFDGEWAYAATQWGGVLKLDLRRDALASRWQPSTQRDTEHEPAIPKGFLRFLDDQRPDYDPDYRPYKPLWALGLGSSGTVMAGGEAGILRRVAVDDPVDLYEESSATVVSRRAYRDRITLPYDGLFVSGIHRVASGGEGEEV